MHELREFLGTCTNNVAEYRSLQLALNKSLELGAEEVHIYSDSELLVRQILGHYRVREPNLQKLWWGSQTMLKKFKKYTLTHVPRERNKTADRLANQAIDWKTTQGSQPFESRKAGESLHRGNFPGGEEIPDSIGHDGL